MVWFNYALLAQFAVLSVGWYFSGDFKQGTYWLGAFILNAAITLK